MIHRSDLPQSVGDAGQYVRMDDVQTATTYLEDALLMQIGEDADHRLRAKSKVVRDLAAGKRKNDRLFASTNGGFPVLKQNERGDPLSRAAHAQVEQLFVRPSQILDELLQQPLRELRRSGGHSLQRLGREGTALDFPGDFGSAGRGATLETFQPECVTWPYEAQGELSSIFERLEEANLALPDHVHPGAVRPLQHQHRMTVVSSGDREPDERLLGIGHSVT